MPLKASTAQAFSMTRSWKISHTDSEAVMDGTFNWALTGSGDNEITAESEDEITIKVLPGAPLHLTINSQASAQSLQEKIPAAAGNSYWIRTYHTPQLYKPTADYMLDIGGSFVPNFSVSGGNVNVDLTFSEEFDSLEVYVVYCVYYDESLYDEDGNVTYTQTDELSFLSVGITIKLEAYEP
jgi:hypothetical protein